jgi:hypothetical protein
MLAEAQTRNLHRFPFLMTSWLWMVLMNAKRATAAIVLDRQIVLTFNDMFFL